MQTLTLNGNRIPTFSSPLCGLNSPSPRSAAVDTFSSDPARDTALVWRQLQSVGQASANFARQGAQIQAPATPTISANLRKAMACVAAHEDAAPLYENVY